MNKKEAIAKFKFLEQILEHLRDYKESQEIMFSLAESYGNFLGNKIRTNPYIFNLIKEYKNTATYRWLKGWINRPLLFIPNCPECHSNKVVRDLGYVGGYWSVFQECNKCGILFNVRHVKK